MDSIDSISVRLDEMAKRHEELRTREEQLAVKTIEPAQKTCMYSDDGEEDERSLPHCRDPKKSTFYLSFLSGQRNSYFQLQFGLSQSSYFRLLLDVKSNDEFQSWYNKNHDPDKEPVELLLLGFIETLRDAKYRCTEDMEEVNVDVFYHVSSMTFIEPEMLHRFFHYFLFEGFTSVYKKYVHGSSFALTTEMLEHLNNFVKAGFFGPYESKMKKRIREIRPRPA
jgi:hypothetical protein